ncbi:hypothetical protein BaRGS_00010090 [Batillaria attramentaria]|uniref:Uncharacterized protein n=1 Tax=Batillaria attramentaria TaxID=370345 RepID=A0ABD0LH25_9CAEN
MIRAHRKQSPGERTPSAKLAPLADGRPKIAFILLQRFRHNHDFKREERNSPELVGAEEIITFMSCVRIICLLVRALGIFASALKQKSNLGIKTPRG